MKLDAHQHFWSYTANPDDFPWMTDQLAAIRRDFLPEDLFPLREAVGIDGTIAVQAREMEVETDFLLDLAADDHSIRGVVGWIDLCAADVEVRLDRQVHNPVFRGVRMLIHDRADPDFADSVPHVHGVSCLEPRGLTYDLLLRAIHLQAAIRLVDKLPHQPFVVDHIAKPRMDGSDLELWEAGMRSIAERPNVTCKISGLVTEANCSNWNAETFGPYLDTVLDAFGTERLMVGSDWPVCTLAAGYAEVLGLAMDWTSKLSPDERADLMGGNCARFYSV